MPDGAVISAAVEGIVDESVVRRLIRHTGGQPGPIYGKNGKSALRQRNGGYNNAAHHAPWVVLIDLDQDAGCAPALRADWLSRPAPRLCFRIAVPEIEAWLLADAETLGAFLGTARTHMPRRPEELASAKAAMVDLARRSRRRSVREDMVPRVGSGRRVGPAYASRLIEYVERHWRPEVAARRAESLRRAIDCVVRLTDGAR